MNQGISDKDAKLLWLELQWILLPQRHMTLSIRNLSSAPCWKHAFQEVEAKVTYSKVESNTLMVGTRQLNRTSISYDRTGCSPCSTYKLVYHPFVSSFLLLFFLFQPS
jgi:hypothetical protein